MTASRSLAPQAAGDVAGYVALSSVATCIGCILGGHLGEAALDPSIGIPRPFCLAPMFTLMLLGSLGVALGPADLLYGNVFLTMFGARWMISLRMQRCNDAVALRQCLSRDCLRGARRRAFASVE